MIFTSSKRPQDMQRTRTKRVESARIEGLEGRQLLTTAVLSFTAAQYVVRENEIALVVTVQRTGDETLGAATVNYTTTDGTAKAGVDYQPVTGTLFFSQGEATTQQIAIPIIDNAAVNPAKDFFISLYDPALTGIPFDPFNQHKVALASPSAAEVVIQDDDAAIQFATTTSSVNENAGVATLTVQRLGVATDHVKVDYTTLDGPAPSGASAGVDYTPVTGTLDFLPNETSKTITIPILKDAVAEGTESIGVQLSNPRIVPPDTTSSPLAPVVLPNNVFLNGFPTSQPSFAAGTALVNILDVDTTAPTVVSVTPNLGKKNKFESLTIQFSEALRQATAQAVSSYGIFNRTADGPFSTGKRTDVKIRSASYNAANNTVTLVPQGTFALNKIYELVVYGNNGPVDVAGNAIDNDSNPATAASNYATFFGVGSNITYTENDGDVVRLKLSRGLMDFRRLMNAGSATINVLQSEAGRSVLTGTVTRRGPVGDGSATISLLGSLAGIDNRLTSPPFVISTPT